MKVVSDTRWQLNKPVPVKPIKTLVARVKSLGDELSQFAVKLEEPTDRVSKFFPKHPPEDDLHIVVQKPAGECELVVSAYELCSVICYPYSPTSISLRFRCGLASHLPTHPSNGARLITVLCSRSFHPLFTPLCFRCRLAPHLPTLPFRLLSVDSSLHGFSLSPTHCHIGHALTFFRLRFY
jgi:hypothetical protein